MLNMDKIALYRNRLHIHNTVSLNNASEGYREPTLKALPTLAGIHHLSTSLAYLIQCILFLFFFTLNKDELQLPVTHTVRHDAQKQTHS